MNATAEDAVASILQDSLLSSNRGATLKVLRTPIPRAFMIPSSLFSPSPVPISSPALAAAPITDIVDGALDIINFGKCCEEEDSADNQGGEQEEAQNGESPFYLPGCSSSVPRNSSTILSMALRLLEETNSLDEEQEEHDKEEDDYSRQKFDAFGEDSFTPP